MSSTNQSPEYLAAQKRYLAAIKDEEKMACLEEMIKFAPKHKGGEAMRANLKTRYKKLQESIETKKKQKKQAKGKLGIKKEGVQVVLIGFSNSGKSSILGSLTNAQPLISNIEFTTKSPLIGAMHYQGILFQIIDMPAVNYESFDQGLVNSADILLIIVTNIKDITQILPFLEKTIGEKIIIFNKIDFLNDDEKRKIDATLKSKKYNYLLLSTKNQESIEELKHKLVENSGVIRVYTKQPGKPADEHPILFDESPTIKRIAEKILKGLSNRIKEAKIWGPSSKFPGQIVGIDHLCKDKDIVEFKTR